MLYVAFRGIDLQAVHLAFVKYVYQKDFNKNLNGFNVSAHSTLNFKIKFRHLPDGSSKKQIARLLRACNGSIRPDRYTDCIDLDTLVFFARCVNSSLLKLLNNPTYVRKKPDSKEIPVVLNSLYNRTA